MLKLRHRLPEGLACLQTLGAVIKNGLCHSNPGCGNADAAIRQDLQRDFQTFSTFANDIAQRHPDALEPDIGCELPMIAHLLVRRSNTNAFGLEVHHHFGHATFILA